LSELQRVIPDPRLQGQLSGHGTDTEEELTLLHPADRFLVELMRMGRIGARVKGMLYKATFDDAYCKVKEVCLCIAPVNTE
jgi:cytokinesis protein